MLAEYGDRFLHRVFTPDEIAYAQARRAPAPHLTARFCAKEATMKALGTGQALGVLWKNVEVIRSDGAPQLQLHGAAAERSRALGVGRTLVSLSHTDEVAVAQVLLLRS